MHSDPGWKPFANFIDYLNIVTDNNCMLTSNWWLMTANHVLQHAFANNYRAQKKFRTSGSFRRAKYFSFSLAWWASAQQVICQLVPCPKGNLEFQFFSSPELHALKFILCKLKFVGWVRVTHLVGDKMFFMSRLPLTNCLNKWINK